MRNLVIVLIIVFGGWQFFSHPPKANWQGQVTPLDPVQTADVQRNSWEFKGFKITPRAGYQIKAVVLSKHSYWAGAMEDQLAQYDLALGWGPMSQASIINQLKISQGGRWYEYHWDHDPPIDPASISLYSSNNHIIPADGQVFEVIKKIKPNDVIELEGYLVDIQHKKENWQWHSSLSRTDTGGGSCELFWVAHAGIMNR